MRLFIAAFFVALCPVIAFAASNQDIDKLTSLATIHGRAVACGSPDFERNMAKTGAWIESTFYGSERSTYLGIFMAGVEYHAKRQSTGQTPDSCSEVLSIYRSMRF